MSRARPKGRNSCAAFFVSPVIRGESPLVCKSAKAMLILNFAHPLTDAQKAQLEMTVGVTIGGVRDIRTHFDQSRPFGEQVVELIDRVGLTGAEWQTLPVLINPPSLAAATAALIAELHGRMGYFPAILRLKPAQTAGPPQFEVAEVLNLQQLRDQARSRRA